MDAEKLHPPEELVAEVNTFGGLMNVKLTWWYDEEILDLVRTSDLKLEFEIRQQCTGVKGRSRVRSFMTAARLEEETPQLYEFVGLSMKPHIFSVRAIKSDDITSGYSASLLVSPGGPPEVVDQSNEDVAAEVLPSDWRGTPEDRAARVALLLALRNMGGDEKMSSRVPVCSVTPTASASLSDRQSSFCVEQKARSPSPFVLRSAENEDFAQNGWMRSPRNAQKERAATQAASEERHRERQSPVTGGAASSSASVSSRGERRGNDASRREFGVASPVDLSPRGVREEPFDASVDREMERRVGEAYSLHASSDITIDRRAERAAHLHEVLNDSPCVAEEDSLSEATLIGEATFDESEALTPPENDWEQAHKPLADMASTPERNGSEKPKRTGVLTNHERKENLYKEENKEEPQSFMSPWLDKILSEKTETMPRAKTFDVCRLDVGIPSSNSFAVPETVRKAPPPSSLSFSTADRSIESRLHAMNMAAESIKKAIPPSISPVTEEEDKIYGSTYAPVTPRRMQSPAQTAVSPEDRRQDLLAEGKRIAHEEQKRLRVEAERQVALSQMQADMARGSPAKNGAQPTRNRNGSSHDMQNVAQTPPEFNQVCRQASMPVQRADGRALNTTVSLPRGALLPHGTPVPANVTKSAYAHVMSPTGRNLDHTGRNLEQTRGVRGLVQRAPVPAVAINQAPGSSVDLRGFIGHTQTSARMQPPAMGHFANPFASMPPSQFAAHAAAQHEAPAPPQQQLTAMASYPAQAFAAVFRSPSHHPGGLNQPALGVSASASQFPSYCPPPGQTQTLAPPLATQPNLRMVENPYATMPPSVSRNEMPAPVKRTAPAFEQESDNSDRYQISIQVSDSHWETMQWKLPLKVGTTLSQICLDFLRERGLKEAFHSGLVQKMNQLPESGQVSAMVDIVDLI